MQNKPMAFVCGVPSVLSLESPSAAQVGLEDVLLQTQLPEPWNTGGYHCAQLTSVFKSLALVPDFHSIWSMNFKRNFNSWFCFRTTKVYTDISANIHRISKSYTIKNENNASLSEGPQLSWDGGVLPRTVLLILPNAVTLLIQLLVLWWPPPNHTTIFTATS